MQYMRHYILWIWIFIGASQVIGGQTPLTPADLRVRQGTPGEAEMHEMLPAYLNKLAQDATQNRLARFNRIQTEADFHNWQESNRRKFLELIGGLPAERSPLHARVIGEIQREGYVIRKVIFESLPEYYVTANLYLPTPGRGPFPAVLAPCGHSPNGKAYDVYQHLFIGLAKRGYVVLSYDPMGQGERYQYWDFLHHESFLKGTDNQHAMAGLQETLLGQNLARYFIWDGIRGLDYLTSLPEVDASRLGVTGSSGGGTLTTYITMLDPRVKVASIVTFITSLPKKIEARSLDVEADPEQDIPGLVAAGLDHTEFLGMIAPRPVLIGAAARDFFPIEGTRRTFAEIQSLYQKLSVPERIKMVEFDHRHMYSQPLREATYTWFDHWLKGLEAEAHEPEIVTEKDATLECTPTGQVITSLGGKRVYDFNRGQAEEELRQLEARRRASDFRTTLAGKIRSRLALSDGPARPAAKLLAQTEVGDLVVEKLQLETEPGISVPTRVIHRQGLHGPSPAVVYLRDRLEERDSPALAASLAGQGLVVAVVDVRGFGETWAARSVRESGEDYFLPRDGRDADFAYAAFLLGRPLLGMRTSDALGAVRYLRTRADVNPQRVAMAGRGWAGITALFAAALDPGISATAVEGIPASYGALASAELYEQPAYVLLPGALQDFDLPDIFAALAPRPLLVMNPQDPLTRKLPQQEAAEALASTRAAYEAAQGWGALEVKVEPLDTNVPKALEDWLRAH
jgi:cephalosporin-C deacetylase-like acetyl esterase